MIRIACGLLALLSGAGNDDRAEIFARLSYEVDLSRKHVGEPQSAAPDVFVRWLSDLELGLTHGHAGRGLVDSGAGLCVASCQDSYRDLGLEARWRLVRGGLLLADTDPFKPQLLVGIGRAWVAGPVAVALDPYVRFGLASRARGNRDFFNVPVAVEARWRGRVGAYLVTGLNGLLAELADYWSVPAALGAVVAPAWGLEVRVHAGLTHVLGPLNTFEDRHLMISVGRGFRASGLQPQPRSRFSSSR